MFKNGLSRGGCLFVVSGIGLAIYAGVYRLMMGHMQTGLDWVIWGIVGASILADAESYLDEIRENTKKIKEQTDKVARQVESIEKSLSDSERAVRRLE